MTLRFLYSAAFIRPGGMKRHKRAAIPVAASASTSRANGLRMIANMERP